MNIKLKAENMFYSNQNNTVKERYLMTIEVM